MVDPVENQRISQDMEMGRNTVAPLALYLFAIVVYTSSALLKQKINMNNN
jgi:hypothetical protein